MSRFLGFVGGLVVLLGLGCSTEVADDEGGGAESDAAPLCSNSCPYAGDGECDDCGEGSEYSVCDIGTDCDDCGLRAEDDECEGGSGWGDDDDAGGSACTSYSFTCQYCSGNGTCSGNCPSSCSSLCQDACESAGCGSVVSCS